MKLHWHSPKVSMHGDTVELVAPCGRYLIELGMAWSEAGGYYVACCDHIQEGAPRLWEQHFPTAQQAKDYAQRVVDEEGWWVDNMVYVEPCPDGKCGHPACVREHEVDILFSSYRD